MSRWITGAELKRLALALPAAGVLGVALLLGMFWLVTSYLIELPAPRVTLRNGAGKTLHDVTLRAGDERRTFAHIGAGQHATTPMNYSSQDSLFVSYVGIRHQPVLVTADPPTAPLVGVAYVKVVLAADSVASVRAGVD